MARKKMNQRFLLAALIVTALALGCLKKQNPGVEAGNPSLPKLVDTQVRLVPETEDQSYLVTILDEETATVAQIQSEAAAALTLMPKKVATVLEEVTVAYTISGETLVLEASFSNGKELSATLSITDDGGDVLSASVQINGTTVTTAFSDNAASDLIETVCRRINTCFAVISQDDCETGLLELDTLTDEFGLPAEKFGLTWQEIVDETDARELVANASSLAQCIEDIETISCASMVGSIDLNDPTNFENVETLIPNGSNTCEGVY